MEWKALNVDNRDLLPICRVSGLRFERKQLVREMHSLIMSIAKREV